MNGRKKNLDYFLGEAFKELLSGKLNIEIWQRCFENGKTTEEITEDYVATRAREMQIDDDEQGAEASDIDQAKSGAAKDKGSVTKKTKASKVKKVQTASIDDILGLAPSTASARPIRDEILRKQQEEEEKLSSKKDMTDDSDEELTDGDRLASKDEIREYKKMLSEVSELLEGLRELRMERLSKNPLPIAIDPKTGLPLHPDKAGDW